MKFLDSLKSRREQKRRQKQAEMQVIIKQLDEDKRQVQQKMDAIDEKITILDIETKRMERQGKVLARKTKEFHRSMEKELELIKTTDEFWKKGPEGPQQFLMRIY